MSLVQEYVDTFNRGDSADLGANWTPQNSSPARITVNKTMASSVGVTAVEQYTGQYPSTNNQYARMTVGTFTQPTSGLLVVMVRMAAVGTLTFYGAGIYKIADTYASDIYKLVGGSYTPLTSESAQTWAPGDVVDLAVVGYELTLRKNGSIVLQVTDGGSSIASGGTGLQWKDNTNEAYAAVSAFSGGIVTAAGTTPAKMHQFRLRRQ